MAGAAIYASVLSTKNLRLLRQTAGLQVGGLAVRDVDGGMQFPSESTKYPAGWIVFDVFNPTRRTIRIDEAGVFCQRILRRRIPISFEPDEECLPLPIDLGPDARQEMVEFMPRVAAFLTAAGLNGTVRLCGFVKTRHEGLRRGSAIEVNLTPWAEGEWMDEDEMRDSRCRLRTLRGESGRGAGR